VDIAGDVALLGRLDVHVPPGFGIILGRGSTAGTLSAAFGFSVILFGTLLGGGVRASQPEPTVAANDPALGTAPMIGHGIQQPAGLGR